MNEYYIYLNSDAQTNGHKGFLHKDANLRARHVKTTTEFAFAMRFTTMRELNKVNRRRSVQGIVFTRLN